MQYALVAFLVSALVLAGCGGGGGSKQRGAARGQQPAPNPPAIPPPALPDVYLPSAPIGMFESPGLYHLDFEVEIVATDQNPRSVDWVLRRVDGSAAASGTIGNISPGIPVGAMAMVTASDNEEFTLVADPQNLIPESGEDNNSVNITAVFTPPPTTVPDVDVRFTDAHYHGLYYYNDLMLHFYVMNPTSSGNDAQDVTFTVSDNDRVIYGPEPVGRMGDSPGSGTVPAPTADQIASGTGYPFVQTEVPTRVIFGDDPNNPDRPQPGRHVFKYELQAPGDTDVSNNARFFTVDVPANKSIPSQDDAGEIPDIQLQDPHFHQTAADVIFHFFIRNVQIAGGPSQMVKWRITRDYDGATIFEDAAGVEVSAGGLTEIPPMQFSESSVGLVGYRLRFDPDDEINEVDEADNEVTFIVDWTPTAPG